MRHEILAEAEHREVQQQLAFAGLRVALAEAC